jgi:hypothetical protein
MSHTTTIKNVEITDLVALSAAITELKNSGVDCELLENAVPRAYYQTQQGMGKAPFVLKLNKSRYDVGFYQKAEATGYEARCDLFGRDVEKVLGFGGNPLGKLMRHYSACAITRKAVQQGYYVNRINRTDGSIQLQVTAR